MEPNQNIYPPKSGTYWGLIGSGIITLSFVGGAKSPKAQFSGDAKSISEKHKITWEIPKETKIRESNPKT